MSTSFVRLQDRVDTITVGWVGPMTDEYVPTGVPFLRSTNIRPHKLDFTDVRHISTDFHAKIAKSRLKAGDVAVVRTGKPGTAVCIPPGSPEMNCSDLVVIRPGSDINGRWLSYYINAVVDGFIASRLVGAVQQHFNISAARDMLIPNLCRDEQDAIAAVLGALDDKIAVNTTLACTADELARARFDAMPRTDEVPLSEMARFINGKAFTKGASGSGRVVIRIAELNSGLGGSTVHNDIEVGEDHLARPGDLLFAWSGSLTVHRWYRADAIINQHIFKVVPQRSFPMWLVHQVLRSRLHRFRAIASDKATTMGHIQRRHLDEPVFVPSPETVAKETELMTGLWRTALAAETENLTLAELRDTLLPALMSGRLRVKEAERQVEDAV